MIIFPPATITPDTYSSITDTMPFQRRRHLRTDGA